MQWYCIYNGLLSGSPFMGGLFRSTRGPWASFRTSSALFVAALSVLVVFAQAGHGLLERHIYCTEHQRVEHGADHGSEHSLRGGDTAEQLRGASAQANGHAQLGLPEPDGAHDDHGACAALGPNDCAVCVTAAIGQPFAYPPGVVEVLIVNQVRASLPALDSAPKTSPPPCAARV